MTSLNLATIFGPNLLHKQKKDKEFAVQSFARAEESTAIISVVQRMINTYDTLFMVSHAYCKQKCIYKQLKTAHGLIKQSQGHSGSCFVLFGQKKCVYGEFCSLIQWSLQMICNYELYGF